MNHFFKKNVLFLVPVKKACTLVSEVKLSQMCLCVELLLVPLAWWVTVALWHPDGV